MGTSEMPIVAVPILPMMLMRCEASEGFCEGSSIRSCFKLQASSFKFASGYILITFLVTRLELGLFLPIHCICGQKVACDDLFYIHLIIRNQKSEIVGTDTYKYVCVCVCACSVIPGPRSDWYSTDTLLILLHWIYRKLTHYAAGHTVHFYFKSNSQVNALTRAKLV